MTWRKKLVVAGAMAVVLGVGAVATLVVSERTYIQRLRHFRQQLPTPAEWFEPKQIVAGSPSTERLRVAPANPSPIPTNLLARAVESAIQGNALAFLILCKGEIVAEHYAPSHGWHLVADSASMMKTVTALLVGIASSDGHIASVDERASAYLPVWARDERRDITIRHLLQMRSGLRPEGAYEDPFSDACYLALGTDARYVVENCPAATTAGTRYDYSNVNYQALGLILEKATGRPFADYLSEKLWKPLGNRDAALWLDHKGGVPRTFGFLFATAEDWARVGELILNRGSAKGQRIVPAEWIDFMCTPSPTEPTYGSGIYTGVDDPEDPPFAYAGIVALNGRNKQRVYSASARENRDRADGASSAPVERRVPAESVCGLR